MLPAACSGDMYAGVPITAPSSVAALLAAVGAALPVTGGATLPGVITLEGLITPLPLLGATP